MTVNQTSFTDALLDPDLTAPIGLTDPEGRPAGKRFAVYRNNVAVSLTEALITAFPVIYKLVGDEFFRALAGVYLRQHPPKTALMMHYGEDLPSFLQGFEPVSHLGYLPDVARVELAVRQSYHAADSQPISIESFQSISPDQLMASSVQFAPAIRLVASEWPIYAIWRANTQDNAPKPIMQPETVLITRPEFDPIVAPATRGSAEFVAALISGNTFGDAIDAAASTDSGFDLSSTLGQLLTGNAIISIKKRDQK